MAQIAFGTNHLILHPIVVGYPKNKTIPVDISQFKSNSQLPNKLTGSISNQVQNDFFLVASFPNDGPTAITLPKYNFGTRLNHTDLEREKSLKNHFYNANRLNSQRQLPSKSSVINYYQSNLKPNKMPKKYYSNEKKSMTKHTNIFASESFMPMQPKADNVASSNSNTATISPLGKAGFNSIQFMQPTLSPLSINDLNTGEYFMGRNIQKQKPEVVIDVPQMIAPFNTSTTFGTLYGSA